MNKPTLIFLHGGPGFKDYLSPYFFECESHFNTVFYNQLRGPDVTVEKLIFQLDDVMDSFEGKKIIVGHSWGGVLAVEYARQKAHRLSGLVLMSTGLSHKHWYDDFMSEKKRLNLVDATPADIFLTADERAVGTELLDSSWETFSVETFDSLEKSFIRHFDLTHSFGELKLPMLNIFGEKDVRFPASAARLLPQYNMRLKNVEITGAGHFPFLSESGKKKIIQALITEFA